MIKVLEQAIDKIKTLPDADQARAAQVLEALAAQVVDEPLTPGEIEGIRKAQAEVRQGHYASDSGVEAFFRRHRS